MGTRTEPGRGHLSGWDGLWAQGKRLSPEREGGEKGQIEENTKGERTFFKNLLINRYLTLLTSR